MLRKISTSNDMPVSKILDEFTVFVFANFRNLPGEAR